MFLDLISKKEEKVKDFNMWDKIGYAFGDIGCSLFFAFVSSYLMVFYTDVLGIASASVGTLFIVARIWDAINDPMMGTIIDKKKATKHGKFRPYVVRFGFPLVIVGILTFTAIPGMKDSLKLPYAYVTYILFGMLYTAVNIPYGSLASVMTKKSDERTALSTFRNIGSLIGNLFVMLVVPMIIFNREGKVTAKGFLICAIFIAILSSISFILNFRLTRERVTSNNSAGGAGLNVLKALLKNRAFIGLSLATFFMLASSFTISSLNVFLFKEYFKAPKLIAVGGMVGLIASFVVIPFIGVIVKKLGKKETAVTGAILASAIYAIMLVIPNLNAQTYIALSFVAGLGTGLINTIIFALVSDAIDYQEYISGERNEGTVYSSYSLARKLSQAFAGGMGAYALAFLGYEPGGLEQSASIGIGIKNITLGLALFGYVITALILIFIYNLSKSKLEEVNKELDSRRANN